MLTTRLDRPFRNAKVLGLDIETTGLDAWQDQVTAIALSDGEQAIVVDVRNLDPQRVAEWLKANVFDRPTVLHNAMFDLVFLARQFNVPVPDRTWDTYLAERLLTAGLPDPDNPKKDMSCSLKDAVQRRLGIEISKDEEIRTGFLLDNEWSDEQVRYAATDAKVLIPLYQQQKKEISRKRLDDVWTLERAALPVFCRMRLRGITIDLERMKPLLDVATRQREELLEDLQQRLTPYLHWPRERRNQEEQAKLDEWNARFQEAKQAFLNEWFEGHDRQEWRDRVRSEYEGTEIDPAKDGTPRRIDLKEIESWFDEAVDKKDGLPKGAKRYVNRMMYLWRRQPGNERPTIQIMDISKPINPDSPTQLRQALEEMLNEYNENNGAKLVMPENLERDTLKWLLAEWPDPLVEGFVDPLLKYRKAAKFISSFGNPLPQYIASDGRLHGEIEPIGTATGRPSMSRPNLLQIPKKKIGNDDFRKCFVAAPGHVFIVADFSQIELRIMAQLSGDPELIRAFRNGEDLHRKTAAGTYEIPLDQVTEEQRSVGKTTNFGIMYGLQEQGLMSLVRAQGLKITEDEARRALAMWRRMYRKASAAIEAWGEEALRRGWTSTAFGRRRFFDLSDLPYWKRGAIRRQGANHVIQGTSADITKMAMVGIDHLIRNLDGYILLNVYDEIVVEVPERYAEEARRCVVTAMEHAARMVLRDVPVQVDAVISPSWSEEEAVA